MRSVVVCSVNCAGVGVGAGVGSLGASAAPAAGDPVVPGDSLGGEEDVALATGVGEASALAGGGAGCFTM